jgi:N-ethylmaleimide reductase
MVAHARNKLFAPVQIGAITLKHRVVMPPLSRLRAEWPSGVPSDLMLEYYSQRASDGGLIFTEATAVSPSARGYRGAPGIYSDEQVTGWQRVTRPSFYREPGFAQAHRVGSSAQSLRPAHILRLRCARLHLV